MHQPSNLQPFLDRLNSRSILSEREQRQILDLPIRIRQARPNEDFVHLGERVDHACLVVAGLVGRFDQNARSDRQITALHIPGDMPDLHSVVQPTSGSALQALSTTTLLEISHTALRAATAEFPAIAEALWRDTMVDAAILSQWMVNVGRRDARTRLSHLLCEMACRYQRTPRNGKLVFQLPMTQAHLADATGLTAVHINRTLKSLEGIGTLFRHKTVRIDNWQALAEAGDFDHRYLQMNLAPEERIRIVQ